MLYRNACLALLTLSVSLAGCQRAITPGPHADTEQALALRTSLAAGAGGQAEAGPVAVGEGWAALAGQFTFDPKNDPPAPASLTVDKDREVCAPGGEVVLSRSMLVDEETRGIANVLIFLREAVRTHPSLEISGEPAVFDQQACMFLSPLFAVQAGRPIGIKNSDPVLHNTNVQAVRNAPFNFNIPPGQTVLYEPTKAERLPISVSCSIHPWMSAYMMTCENGYFAVTDAQGRFRIDNLPAGVELEFQVWHEMQSGGPSGGLGLQHPELNWNNRGRFTINLEKDSEQQISVVCPATAFR